MKKLRYVLVTVLAHALLSLSSHAEEEIQYRQFTSTDGKAISAVVLTKTETEVTFLLENGKRATVPIDRLSDDDKEYIGSWNQAKAIFIRECRSLSIGELLTLRGYEAIPVKFENNSILVEAKLNGHPAKFIIDTGAASSLIHTGSCERVGAELGPFDEKVYGVSGEAPAAWTVIDELTVGESTFSKRRFLATDMLIDRPEAAKASNDGLFGAELLADLDAVISYQERKLFFRPDKSDNNTTDGKLDEDALTFRIFKTKDRKIHRGEVTEKTSTIATIKLTTGKTIQIPIAQLEPEDAKYVMDWTEAKALFQRHCRSLTVHELLDLREYQNFKYTRMGNHIFVDGKINDDEVLWLIDTGADNSLLHLAAAKKHGIEVGPMDKKVYGIGGTAPAAACLVESVSLGEAVFRKRQILTTDLDRFQQNIPYVGLFGADFMRESNAVITYSEQRIFLKQ